MTKEQLETKLYLEGKGWKHTDSWLDWCELIILMERDGAKRIIYETGWMKTPDPEKLSSNQKTQRYENA